MTNNAIEYIGAADDAKPIFLYAAYTAVHTELHDPDVVDNVLPLRQYVTKMTKEADVCIKRVMEKIAEFFTEAENTQWKDARQYIEDATEKTDHGRHEIYACHACHIPEKWLNNKWHRLAQILRITRTRTNTKKAV